MKKIDKHFMVRIRYTDNYRGEGKEAYVFENKLANEEKWGTDTAYVLKMAASVGKHWQKYVT